MKKLFSSLNVAEIGLLKNCLRKKVSHPATSVQHRLWCLVMHSRALPRRGLRQSQEPGPMARPLGNTEFEAWTCPPVEKRTKGTCFLLKCMVDEPVQE